MACLYERTNALHFARQPNRSPFYASHKWCWWHCVCSEMGCGGKCFCEESAPAIKWKMLLWKTVQLQNKNQPNHNEIHGKNFAQLNWWEREMNIGGARVRTRARCQRFHMHPSIKNRWTINKLLIQVYIPDQNYRATLPTTGIITKQPRLPQPHTHTQTHPESFAHVLSRLLRSLIQRNIIYIIIKYGELWWQSLMFEWIVKL